MVIFYPVLRQAQHESVPDLGHKTENLTENMSHTAKTKRD